MFESKPLVITKITETQRVVRREVLVLPGQGSPSEKLTHSLGTWHSPAIQTRLVGRHGSLRLQPKEHTHVRIQKARYFSVHSIVVLGLLISLRSWEEGKRRGKYEMIFPPFSFTKSEF